METPAGLELGEPSTAEVKNTHDVGHSDLTTAAALIRRDNRGGVGIGGVDTTDVGKGRNTGVEGGRDY